MKGATLVAAGGKFQAFKGSIGSASFELSELTAEIQREIIPTIVTKSQLRSLMTMQDSHRLK